MLRHAALALPPSGPIKALTTESSDISVSLFICTPCNQPSKAAIKFNIKYMVKLPEVSALREVFAMCSELVVVVVGLPQSTCQGSPLTNHRP